MAGFTRFILVVGMFVVSFEEMAKCVPATELSPIRDALVSEPFMRVNETEMANFMRLSHLTKYFFPGPLSIFRPAYRLPSQLLTDMMPVTNFSQFGRATRVELPKPKDERVTTTPPTTTLLVDEEVSKPEVSVFESPTQVSQMELDRKRQESEIETITFTPSISEATENATKSVLVTTTMVPSSSEKSGRPEDETSTKLEPEFSATTPKREEPTDERVEPEPNIKIVILTPRSKSVAGEKEIKPSQSKKAIENPKKESKIIRLLSLKFLSNAKPIGVVINGQTKEPKRQTTTLQSISS